MNQNGVIFAEKLEHTLLSKGVCKVTPCLSTYSLSVLYHLMIDNDKLLGHKISKYCPTQSGLWSIHTKALSLVEEPENGLW